MIGHEAGVGRPGEDSRIATFRRALTVDEKSRATVEKYCREAGRLLSWLQGRAITPERMLEYRALLRERHRPQTVNGKLSAVNAFLRCTGQADCCVKLLRIQRRAFVQDSRELTENEYRRLVCAAQSRQNERLRLVMETLCATGIRVSELRGITVEAVRCGRAEIAMKGKVRVVLIPKRLRAALRAYAQRLGVGSGCIFRTRRGKPLDRSNIWRDMKRLGAEARVCQSKIFPHNLCHLFARTYYAMEKDIAHLADILGHSSVETTRIYLAVSEREHGRVLERIRLII